MVKARLFLSVVSGDVLALSNHAANVMKEFRLCANVVPLWSSVHNNSTGGYGVEAGCRIDILSDAEEDQILLLWTKLREAFGIHCVWLDVHGYSGCICNWPYYVQNFDKVNHESPMKCSEYTGLDATGHDADGNRREYW